METNLGFFFFLGLLLMLNFGYFIWENCNEDKKRKKECFWDLGV